MHTTFNILPIVLLSWKQWKAIRWSDCIEIAMRFSCIFMYVNSNENRITMIMNSLWPTDCQVKCNISNYLVNFRFSLVVESFERACSFCNWFIAKPLTDDDAIVVRNRSISMWLRFIGIGDFWRVRISPVMKIVLRERWSKSSLGHG